MMLALKLFGTAVMVYGAARLSGIAIKWMRRGFDQLDPKYHDKDF